MAATADKQAPDMDLAAWIAGRREAILQAIRFHDGEANTSEIRDYSGVPRGSYNHHVEALLSPPEYLRAEVDWIGEGLIEETGRVNIGKPAPARQFALTDAGKRAIEIAMDDDGIRASDVRNLQDELAASKERITELEADFEEMKQRYNEMADFVEDLAADRSSS